MSQFQALLATLRGALAAGAPAQSSADTVNEAKVIPVARAAHRAELSSRFARELEAVNGHTLQLSSESELSATIADLARKFETRSIAVGPGITANLERTAQALAALGFEIFPSGRIADADRAGARMRMSACGLGVAEASCAIAASGTLAVAANERGSRSLTLLPPVSVIVVDVDRIVADLAAAMRALGPIVADGGSLSLITGPSRTADIEKRLVLGAHGPKHLYALVLWP